MKKKLDPRVFNQNPDGKPRNAFASMGRLGGKSFLYLQIGSLSMDIEIRDADFQRVGEAIQETLK